MTFSRSILVAIGIGALVTGLLAAIILSRPVHNPLAVFLLLTSVMLCTAMLVQSALSRFACLPTLLVLIYFLLYNIVPALFQVGLDTYFWRLLIYDTATTAAAAALTLLFLVCFAAGQALATERHYASAVETIRESERHGRTLTLAAVAIIAFLVGITPVRLFGASSMMQSRGSLSELVFAGLDQTGMGLLVYLPRAVLFTGFILMLYGLTRRRSFAGGLDRYAVFAPLFLLLLPLQMIVNFPGAQSRFWLFGMLITLGLMFVSFRSVARRLLLIAVFVIGTFTVFPISQQINRSEGFNFDIELPKIEEYLTHGDLDGFQSTMNTIVYVDQFGHTYGRQLASAVLFFVPRGIWSGKSLATGNMTSLALGFDFNNLSAPIIAELYIDGAFFAVILGAFAIGYAYRRLDYLFTAASDIGGVTLYRVLLALVCGFSIILMRGSLLGVIAPVASSIGAVYLVIKAPQWGARLMRQPEPAARRARLDPSPPAAKCGSSRAREGDANAVRPAACSLTRHGRACSCLSRPSTFSSAAGRANQAGGRGPLRPRAREVLEGIDRRRPLAQLEMELDAVGAAGAAGPGDHLAAAHPLAPADQQPVVVGVGADPAGLVLDQDHVAEAAELVAGIGDDAVLDGADRRAA